jgi:hypothetical protein
MVMTTTEKISALRQLELGDIVLCTNGNEYEFIRLKQSKFIGKRVGGPTYDIPVEMFVEMVRKSDKVAFDPSTLQQGDLFYVLNGKQELLLYKYKYMINADKLMAENPVTSQGVRIPATMVKGSVRELQRS